MNPKLKEIEEQRVRMGEIRHTILSLADNGIIRGDLLLLLVDDYGIDLLRVINKLKDERKIKDSFVPVKGTSYTMDYDVIGE